MALVLSTITAFQMEHVFLLLPPPGTESVTCSKLIHRSTCPGCSGNNVSVPLVTAAAFEFRGLELLSVTKKKFLQISRHPRSIMISAIHWIRRGVAAQHPEKFKLDEKEYERISQIAADRLGEAKVDLKAAREAVAMEVDSDSDEEEDVG